MHDQARIREGRHHRAGAAGMVEVDVREQHVIDAFRCQAQRGERFLRARQAGVAAGVDEGGAAVIDDQVDGGQLVAHIAGVEGDECRCGNRSAGLAYGKAEVSGQVEQ